MQDITYIIISLFFLRFLDYCSEMKAAILQMYFKKIYSYFHHIHFKYFMYDNGKIWNTSLPVLHAPEKKENFFPSEFQIPTCHTVARRDRSLHWLIQYSLLLSVNKMTAVYDCASAHNPVRAHALSRNFSFFSAPEWIYIWSNVGLIPNWNAHGRSHRRIRYVESIFIVNPIC